MQIASITTNEQGEYEYATEEDYLEQTLDIIIQKEGFERKNISYEIDKAEINSDFLLNELEEVTKEKTRIFGTIRNSKTRDPVKAASITLNIEGTQIAAITSDELGRYEYTAEEDYTGQTLDYVIQKEGYKRQDISHEIDRFEIESDFLMDEIEIKIKGKICDETDSPLDNASISFSIGGSTINLVSDKNGSFSFTIGLRFLNQTIGYEASREGFKFKSGKLRLVEDLGCIHLPPPTIPLWIIIAAVGIILVGIAIILIPPDLSIDPDPMDFDFVPGTGAQTFSIWNDGYMTLDWDVYSDQDWIIVSPDSGTDDGTVSVSVNSAGMDPGRYAGIITVESNGGTKTGRVSLDTLIDGEQLRIHFFNADPEIFNNEEGETTLSWNVSGATSVTIDGVGPVEVSEGSIDRWVEQTTTFILRATNDAGESDVRETTVYVEIEPVVIHSFIAEPNHIDGPGGETTLSWEVTGATSVTIDDIGPVEVSESSIDRWVEKTTTFILRATNDAGVPDVRTTRVYVEGENLDEPVIHYFIANPEIISSGEKSTLQWDVSGVETVTIDKGIGEMDGIGNTDVFLDETTTFILAAENDAGRDAEPVTVEFLQPELSVNPSTLQLDFDIGPQSNEADYTKTFSIRNSGEGNLHWSIKAYDMSNYNWNWINVDPDKGVIKANNYKMITIEINTAEINSGDYEGRIFIDSNVGTFYGDINLDLQKDGSLEGTLVKATSFRDSFRLFEK